MIGQHKFKQFMNGWTDTPPRFIMLQGEKGSGRSTIIDLIKHKYSFNVVTCGTSVDEVRNIITTCYSISEPTFYIFYNGDKLSISAKNSLLKLVEEPPLKAYFIIRLENTTLPTLVGRSFYYEIQPYTPQELKQGFIDKGKEEVYNKYPNICRNIGQINTFINSPYEDIIEYCDTIISCISTVAEGNIFNITNKLNIDESVDKWDYTLFLNILEYSLYNKLLETKDDKYFQAIYRINDVRRKLRINGVSKLSLFDNFFIGLKELL